MIKSILARLLGAKTIAKSDRIMGNLSQGRVDSPGVWWKAN